MTRRLTAIFWSATAVAVLLLGSAFSTGRRILTRGTAGAADVAVLLVVGLGLIAAVLVAGRIVLAVARSQRGGRGGGT